MASIIKLKSGKWQARVSYKNSSDGKFKQKTNNFNTKIQANEWSRKLELGKDRTDLSKRDISFIDYFINWYETFRVTDVSIGTMNRYENTGNLIEEFFKDECLIDVTKSEYQQFINEYGQKHAKATVTRVNSYIRAMCLEAIDEQIIYKDFTRNVRLIAGKPTRASQEKYLEKKDFETLIEYAKKHANFKNTSLFEIYFVCESGARYEESAALTWDCVNFDDNTVTFDKAYSIQTKKLKSTKTKSSYRTIKISESIIIRLAELKKEQTEYFERIKYVNKHNFVFRNSHRELPSNTACNKMLKETLDKCKIKNKLDFMT
nr:tyrosine-type recombinase/integrase [Companilactobacillus huachuanensis]